MRNSSVVNIAIVSDGGVGDCICNLNYAKALKEYSGSNTEIDFFVKTKIVCELYDSSEKYLRRIYKKNEYKRMMGKYDVVICMKERFPFVLKYDEGKLIRKEKNELVELISRYKGHYEKFKKFYKYSPSLDGYSVNLSLIMGFNRVTQPDVDHLLGIKDLNIRIPLNDEDKVLSKYKLIKNAYITLNRSVDSNKKEWESTKLWSKERYLELINLIKFNNINIKIVYLGPKHEDWLPSTVINLSGETNFNDLKVILKHSILHIGPEGGMIHLRHCIKGGVSCVLFGSTSRKFYGYKENINIENKKCCCEHCEWITDQWNEVCPKTQSSSTCEKLQQLTSNSVFSTIKYILREKHV